MMENDKVGYKAARTQQLYLKSQKAPTTVWQQIGAQDPAKEAQSVMMQNDKVGYKAARTQQLFNKPQKPTTVWQQIGARDPAREAQKVMFENDKVGYKAATQMLANKPQGPTTVWQQIGAQDPSKEAENVMYENDKVGYKAATQMLSEKDEKIPTVNVWQQIGEQVRGFATRGSLNALPSPRAGRSAAFTPHSPRFSSQDRRPRSCTADTGMGCCRSRLSRPSRR